MSWFTRGIEDVLEHVSDSGGGVYYTPEFFLRKNEKEVLFQIIDKEPINCHVHTITKIGKNGYYYPNKTCTGDESCYYCEALRKGIKAVGNARFTSHLSVLDSRIQKYRDDNGDDAEGCWTRRLWRASSTRFSTMMGLSKISRTGVIRGVKLLVSRSGVGTKTTWTFEYVTNDDLLQDEFDPVVSDLGWDPEKSLFAPCPNMKKVKPFDYETILKPDTYEEAAEFLGSDLADDEDVDDDEDDDYAEEFSRGVRRRGTTRRSGGSSQSKNSRRKRSTRAKSSTHNRKKLSSRKKTRPSVDDVDDVG